MNIVERAARSADRAQQKRPFLAFPYAVIKKFGDDNAGGLASLIAYYGFFSLFPLLLVFVSILGFALSNNPSLREHILNTALGQFPVIGNAIAARASVHPLEGNWPSIIIGGLVALWGGLGVAQAAETAMNTVWDVPRSEWPNFVFRRVRAIAMLALLGLFVILSSFVSGYGISGVLSSRWATLGWVFALGLNFALFTIAYQVLTAAQLRWRDVMPGAACAAVAWTALQALGGYYLTHELKSSSDVYGTFALVITLLIWLSLGAQLTLFCAEINVVRQRRLWPRSFVQPPINDGDERVYRGIVERARMRPEVAVDVWFTSNHDKQRAGRSGAEPIEPSADTQERTDH